MTLSYIEIDFHIPNRVEEKKITFGSDNEQDTDDGELERAGDREREKNERVETRMVNLLNFIMFSPHLSTSSTSIFVSCCILISKSSEQL